MTKLSLLAILTFTYLIALPTAQADDWHNRPEVIRSADLLAQEVEHLDEALHNVNAPVHVLEKVHHFEETVFDFVDDVRGGAPYIAARDEFNHIREDVKAIQRELYAHPHLLRNPRVWQEWSAMRRAYRYLDHAMLHHHHRGAHDASLEADIRALEDHSAERN